MQEREEQKGEVIEGVEKIEGFGEEEERSPGEKSSGGSKKGLFILLGGLLVFSMAALGGLFLLASGGEEAKGVKQTDAAQATRQRSQETAAQGGERTAQTVQTTEKFLIEKVNERLEEKLERLKAELLYAVNERIEEGLKPALSRLERLESRLRRLEEEVKNSSTFDQLEELKRELESIKSTVSKLTELQKSVLANKTYPLLGTLTVEEVTPSFVRINGVNYWVGDEISLTVGSKTRSYTVVSIQPELKLMVVEDEWGNRYSLSLR